MLVDTAVYTDNTYHPGLSAGLYHQISTIPADNLYHGQYIFSKVLVDTCPFLVSTFLAHQIMWEAVCLGGRKWKVVGGCGRPCSPDWIRQIRSDLRANQRARPPTLPPTASHTASEIGLSDRSDSLTDLTDLTD